VLAALAAGTEQLGGISVALQQQKKSQRKLWNL
jgi:hypothetical protein